MKNQTFHRPPRAGDGTLHQEAKPDANTFGLSQEPQEEFICEIKPDENGIDINALPLASEDVFPFGGPAQQTDG